MVQNWYHVDASGHVVGKLAQEIVHILSGKHKPTYHHATDHAGDYVVVTNAEKMVLTGNSWYNKEYIYHTGRAGGLKVGWMFVHFTFKNSEIHFSNDA